MPINSVSALKQQFSNVFLDDHIVDWREVRAVIAKAKDGGAVTASELRYLHAQFKATKDYFHPDARRDMEDFLKTGYRPYAQPDAFVDEQGRTNLPDPVVMAEHRDWARFMWTGAPLHIDADTPDEVLQGQLGDCYLVASLAALATRDPDFFKKKIVDNGNGTYTLKFTERHLFGLFKTTDTITVDGQLPAGGSLYGHTADGSTWVGIVEKAYATWRGGYDKIGKGGWPSKALSALTGKRTNMDLIWFRGPDDLKKTLAKAQREGKAAVATTWNPESKEIVPAHAYTVLGVTERGGQTFVQLRNPWGSQPGGDGKFELEMNEFRKQFFAIFVG